MSVIYELWLFNMQAMCLLCVWLYHILSESICIWSEHSKEVQKIFEKSVKTGMKMVMKKRSCVCCLQYIPCIIQKWLFSTFFCFFFPFFVSNSFTKSKNKEYLNICSIMISSCMTWIFGACRRTQKFAISKGFKPFI